MLEYVPDELKTAEICLLAVMNKDYGVKEFVPEKYRPQKVPNEID